MLTCTFNFQKRVGCGFRRFAVSAPVDVALARTRVIS